MPDRLLEYLQNQQSLRLVPRDESRRPSQYHPLNQAGSRVTVERAGAAYTRAHSHSLQLAVRE